MNKLAEISQDTFRTQTEILGTGPLAYEKYMTEEFFELEKEKIFKKAWLRMGRAAELPNVGDYVVRQLEVASTSILLVRSRDGEIRGFHNVCSHRGNQVALKSSGNQINGFSCAFHGWTYGLEGELKYVPEEVLFHGLDKKCNGLTPVSVGLWEGWIFINLDPNPRENLKDYLGELWGGFAGYFDDKIEVASIRMEVNCNWKIALDAFVENYHFAFIHRVSAKGIFGSPENPYGRFDAVKLYPRHRTTSGCMKNVYDATRTQMLLGKIAGKAQTYDAAAGAGVAATHINPMKLQNWLADITIVAPTANFKILGPWYEIMDFWPVAHNRIRWEKKVYAPAASNAGAWLAQEYNTAFIRDLIREDWNYMEKIQAHIKSGAKTHWNYSDQEVMIRHGYKVVDDFIDS